eukprot:CAMPEP_0201130072 /NCGR_PEP_ID=MMETSP0850-20130426/38790_1 /ASSEMBLY_ACC=CAM_ASM_000622 /TAXON_ID=183588 /ORGANISM="Pseudo-nitzschia fraudulenta, Strain WWA7" /LENGTH=45 /DNA_ID= /DNA_START= /DNA_END= /DNA_ORIENTATION=
MEVVPPNLRSACANHSSRGIEREGIPRLLPRCYGRQSRLIDPKTT